MIVQLRVLIVCSTTPDICSVPQLSDVSPQVSCSRHTHLHSLPAQSPLFTTNLIAAIGEVYSGLGSQDPAPAPAPPQQVVALVTAWLRAGHEAGGGEGRGPGVPRVPVPGTSPAASLLPWSVLSSYITELEKKINPKARNHGEGPD